MFIFSLYLLAYKNITDIVSGYYQLLPTKVLYTT